MLILLPGLIVALINAGVIYHFWHRKIVWWEAAIPVVLSLFVGMGCNLFAKMVLTRDVEYWGGWGVVAYHQEPWTEWYEVEVDDYCTRPVLDMNGNITVETYKCGSHMETRYRQHPEEWWIEDSNGHATYVDSGEFEWLSRQHWENSSRSDGHNSDYYRVSSGFQYSGDGYLHVSQWPGTDSTFLPMTTSHSWTNRILAADKSLFHFEPVPQEDREANGIYEWPSIDRFYRMQYIQGDHTPKGEEANQKLQEWNAKLGQEKQVQMRILVFTDKPFDAAQDQEAHWMGGKKNEFIVCVGIDGKSRQSQWAYVISWCENEDLKIQIRDYARKMEPFNASKLVDYMVPLIREKFQRKQFHDFDYLKIPTPTWAYWLSFVLCVIVTIGVDAWAIRNGCDAEHSRRKQFCCR